MPNAVPKRSTFKAWSTNKPSTLSLIANVANLYYTLLMLDEQYRISEETAASWRESVRTMRA